MYFMAQLLENTTIADFSQLFQGPWATQKLAEMGADVIKIEPVTGEWMRSLRIYEDVSPNFLAVNRNKRSIAVDLKSEEGLEIVKEVIAKADIVTENFRPGVMERLGLGYDDIRNICPDIIYVSASGFGPDGPYADRPGQDLLFQAMSGLTKQTGRRQDPPTPVGTSIVDEHSAMLIALYTTFALLHKERTGEGQKVEVNLLNSAIDFQCQGITAALNSDKKFERSSEGIMAPRAGPTHALFETVDGYVAIAMAPLDTLSEVLSIDGLEEYDTDRKAYENRDLIKRQIESFTRRYSTDELIEILLDADIWASKVNDYEDLANHPQVNHNEILVELDHPLGGSFITTGIPVSMSRTPCQITLRPPRLGEHTREVLHELGYHDDTIQTLSKQEVIKLDDSH